MTGLKLDRLCLLLISICGSLVGICQAQSLSVLGQQTIRPFATFTVSITNTLPQAVNLELKLTGGNMDHVRNISLIHDYQKRVTFETQNIEGSDYSLSIRSLDPSVNFSETIDLIPVDKSFLIFIQIDKPIYKPGDTMNFRVIVVDADTRPVTHISNVEVSLKDSKDTSIRDWPFAKLHKGVFESSVVLPSSPNLGSWSLTVGSREVERTIFFEVKQYVLPKFWIKVYPTETPLSGSKSIKLTVESCFTFDRPVSGRAQVDLYLEKLQNRADYSATKPIERISTFEFFLKDEIYVELGMDYHDVLVNVTVTEAHTKTTLFVLEPIRVYRNAFDITLRKRWPMFRPGMPYPMDFTFKDKQGKVACIGQTVNVQITYRHTNEDENEVEVSGIIDNKGLLSLANLIPPKTANEMTVKIQHKSVEFEEYIEGAVSLSNQYLRISSSETTKRLHPNEKVEIEIVCSEAMKHFTYVLVARGNIFDSGFVKVNRRKEYKLKITLKPILAPKAHIIVFYTNKQYMIWDDMELNFDTFENNLKLSLDQNKYNPGQDLNLDVEASPDSYVAFHAIDQSVLTLNNDWNGLTRENILKELGSFDGKLEFGPLEALGLFLRTTSKKDSDPGILTRNGFQNSMEIPFIRSFFPESWLWQNLTMDGKTKATLMAQVPDTVTSWFVTGFALSPTTGLSIIDKPLSFTVEKSFYVVANLPYSIRRGEVAAIKVQIFCLLCHLIANVSLLNQNDEIEFVGEPTNQSDHQTKQVLLTGSSRNIVTFYITTKKIGTISVKIVATNIVEHDTIEHILRVEPESYFYKQIMKRKYEVVYSGFEYRTFIEIPRHHIEGSMAIEFMLDATTFTIPTENITNVINFPNKNEDIDVTNFASYGIVMDYIIKSGFDDDDLKSKLVHYLILGYDNLLKYKLKDGSFGVKNGRQIKSSIFFTSLTTKSLTIASNYVTDIRDNNNVDVALQWLSHKQKTDGSFVEDGNLSSYSLTAYVLSTFLEIGAKASRYSANVDSAVDYLVKNHHKTENIYDLAIVAYALSLKKHVIGKKCLYKVMEKSSSRMGFRYWDGNSHSDTIASYIALAHIQYDSFLEAYFVLSNISAKIFSIENFLLNQDTLILLKAVAEYAAKSPIPQFEYSVFINNDIRPTIKHIINKSNAIHKCSLTRNVRYITLKIIGIGAGIFQCSYEYRIELEHVKPGFELDLKLMETSSYDVQHLKVCTKYRNINFGSNRSNLAFVEVFFPSGLHVKDKSEITELESTNKIERIEIKNAGTNLRVYYNNLGIDASCFIVTAERCYDVAVHHPAYVIVYDAVDNRNVAVKKYNGIEKELYDIYPDKERSTIQS